MQDSVIHLDTALKIFNAFATWIESPGQRLWNRWFGWSFGGRYTVFGSIDRGNRGYFHQYDSGAAKLWIYIEEIFQPDSFYTLVHVEFKNTQTGEIISGSPNEFGVWEIPFLPKGTWQIKFY